jgi:flagella basal body P-ring formation protein FlgA
MFRALQTGLPALAVALLLAGACPHPAAAQAAEQTVEQSAGQVPATVAEAAAPRVQVRVLPAAEVAGAEYTVHEVAEVTGADPALVRRVAEVSLGRSPLPGRSQRLSDAFVRARLAQAVEPGRFELTVPGGAEVIRAAQVIPGADVAARVLAFAAEQAVAAGVEVELALAAPIPDAVLPLGNVEWELSPLGQHLSAGGPRTYRVVARVQGEEVWRAMARVNQQAFREVVLAVRPIRRNQVIRPEDVTQERRSVVGMKDEAYLTRGAEAVGARAKRPIGRGEWLHKGLLSAVADVAEGGPVLLVYQTEEVRFAAPGVALVPAQVGEHIPVRNLQSGKIVYGVVQEDESVKVN